MPARPGITLGVTVAAALLAGLVSALPAAAQTPSPNAGIRAKVEAAFADAPTMVAVAKCESGYRQFNADGTVLHGGYGKQYVGIFQIGLALHKEAGLKKGMDIMTVEG